MKLEIPDKVQATAAAQGSAGRAWLANVGDIVAGLAAEWNLTLGLQRPGGTASVVVEVTTRDGLEAVLKVAVPGLDPTNAAYRVLCAASGRGYVRVLRGDIAREAMLLERLGAQLAEHDLSANTKIETICASLLRAWAPLPSGESFMTGVEKAEKLMRLIESTWEEFDRPCAERTVHLAHDYGESRARAFDPAASVMAHGDAHAWNLLADPRAPGSFKFVDPDGLFLEKAYDLGISLRELSTESLAGDAVAPAHRLCRQLAKLTGVGIEPIWQWGFIERTANGLLWLRQGRPELAREFLVAADAWANAGPPQ